MRPKKNVIQPLASHFTENFIGEGGVILTMPSHEKHVAKKEVAEFHLKVSKHFCSILLKFCKNISEKTNQKLSPKFRYHDF